MTNDFVNPHSPYCVLPSHWLNPSVSMGSLALFKVQKQHNLCRGDGTGHATVSFS